MPKDQNEKRVLRKTKQNSGIKPYVTKTSNKSVKSSTPTITKTMTLDLQVKDPLALDESITHVHSPNIDALVELPESEASISPASILQQHSNSISHTDNPDIASQLPAEPQLSPKSSNDSDNDKERPLIDDKRKGHRSILWKHFEEKKDAKGVLKSMCKYCSATYQMGGTGNMKFHLQTKHQDKLWASDGQTTIESVRNRLWLKKKQNNDTNAFKVKKNFTVD